MQVKKFGCALRLMEKNVDAGKVISQKYLLLESKQIKVSTFYFSKLEPVVIKKVKQNYKRSKLFN